ncbi:hypothetical protein ACH7BO_00745, partial [Klebsiella pneumoniae]
KKIGPDPRNFNQRVSLGRNDLLIRTFLRDLIKVNCCFGIIFVRPLPILISGDGFLIKNDMLTTNQHCVISQES